MSACCPIIYMTLHHWKKKVLKVLLMITFGISSLPLPLHSCNNITVVRIICLLRWLPVCYQSLGNIWALQYEVLQYSAIYYSLYFTNCQLLRLFETQIQFDTSQTNLVRKRNQPSKFSHRHKQNNHFVQNVHKFQKYNKNNYLKEKRYFCSASFYKLSGCFVLSFIKFTFLCFLYRKK